MNTDQKRIDILMATYQGEAYLKAQIASILKQSYKNWRLIIRDDGSTDGTKAILESYSNHPKIVIMPSDERLGIIANFSRLMSEATSDYIMFADQDDIWFSDKIQKTYQHMLQMESQYGNKMPLLVHTDLRVVNKHLVPINPSFWRFVNLDAEKRTSFNHLLMQNAVTGCTMMLNKPLLELSRPIPKEVCMHDWWIALTAAAFGKVVPLAYSSIAYRQHDHNNVGAREYGFKNGFKRIWNNICKSKKLNPMFVKRALQASIFLDRYRSQLDKKTIEVLEDYQQYCKGSILSKIRLRKKNDFYKNGFLRNAYELIS